MDMGRGSGTNRDHHSKIEKKIRPKDSLQADKIADNQLSFKLKDS